VRNKIK